MRFSVRLFTRYNRRRPRCRDPRCDLSDIDLTVIGPVDHICCGEHKQRLYLFISIVHIGTGGFKLLMVVRAVDIEPAVVFNCCRIGTEEIGGNGIVEAGVLIIPGTDLIGRDRDTGLQRFDRICHADAFSRCGER